MRPRLLVFITVLALCHLQLGAQTLTNGLPPSTGESTSGNQAAEQAIPDDPGQEILPVAQPEPEPATGTPIQWEAQRQTRAGDTWTLSGDVLVHYRDYLLHADKVTYHQSTSELEVEGHVRLTGGPDDVLINATHGDMRLDMHTGRFYNVDGSMGVRRAGRTTVYSTINPFTFSGRVLLQLGEGHYKMVDGRMTNCRLPKPDWAVLSRSIEIDNGQATARNALFRVLGVPLLYIPYLRHPTEESGRDSGFMIPVLSTGSSIRGYTFGEQVYWAINRSMDMVAGTEYYSKRGWAPNGDFRYKGPGRDHLVARWNALLDRGVEEPSPTDPNQMTLVNQGGVDINVLGTKDLTPNTHIEANVDYLSSYIYRLVFNDNYSQAVSSQVQSQMSLAHNFRGFVPSGSAERFQSFAGSTEGNEARIIHLPNLRFDVLDRPLGSLRVYWGLGSSLGYLSRSEPGFHARNSGRFDIYPHIYYPIKSAGWSIVPEAAIRETGYSDSQRPDLTGINGGTPTFTHTALNRTDFEFALEVRPPAMERDFALTRWNRQLRHVIEPELTYRRVAGIGASERNVLLIDTTDIATDTDELGYSLTQRFYLRENSPKPCNPADAPSGCPPPMREWASWQIAQKFFIDPNFGGALISSRRNVFASTLDLTGVAFLTAARNLAPITSRLRFEAIDNLRVEWDLDYDAKAGQIGADNVYAGYSRGRATMGVGHSLLNAVEENGSAATTIKSQLVQPFLSIGRPTQTGFNLAMNGGYDFTHEALQYAGIQAVYNWDCCGLMIGYRRFDLGSVREETQYLYSFTLANFGSVGDIRRSNTAFRDPALPPAY